MDLVRASPAECFLRSAGDGATLEGHFARFGEWARISSTYEGTFMERVAPGAFSKTFREDRNQIKVLFNHGKDPQLGDRVLGRIVQLEEDAAGAAYEVSLFDGLDPLVLGGLRAGAYGASFRFRVKGEQLDDRPVRSDSNPDAIPERTITEAQVFEFGPVTFPAYQGATAGVRSLTDWYAGERRWTRDRRERELLILGSR